MSRRVGVGRPGRRLSLIRATSLSNRCRYLRTPMPARVRTRQRGQGRGRGSATTHVLVHERMLRLLGERALPERHVVAEPQQLDPW